MQALRSIAFGLSVALAALCAAGGARAQTAGLAGAYYAVGTNPYTNANAEALISGMTPTATFIATVVCFPACDADVSDDNSLSSFLGSNASNLSSNSVSNLSQHVLTLTGYLNISTAGTYTLSLASDDGSKLVIDGVELSNDGDHGMQTVSADYTLSAGLHTISILQFEDGGYTGLTVKINGTALDASMLVTSVPEPGSWLMFGAGGLLLVWRLRRPQA